MSHNKRKKQFGSIKTGVNRSENMGVLHLQVKDELESNPHSMSTLPEDNEKWEEFE